MLAWLRPSAGAKDEVSVAAEIKGEKRTITFRPLGATPATLEYAVIATTELNRKLPLKSLGTIELPDPAGLFPAYALIPLDNATYLLGHASGLSHTNLNSFHSMTFQALAPKDRVLTAAEQRWTLPRRVRFLWTREGVERYLKSHGLTEEQALALRGAAAEEEFFKDYANPVLALHEKANVVLCVGTIDQGIHPDAGNIWITSSADAGKTWAPQTPFGWGFLPTLAVRDGEVFVVATDRVRQILIPDYMWGYWPDDWPKGAAWPVLGKLMLWRWQWGQALPQEPVVVVHEPKAVQSTLAVRDDGLLVLIYAKTEYVGSTTSLWITTSRDGAHWETPRQLTDGKFLDRDASAVFYRDALWIAFARAEGRMPSSIYLMTYDHLPPVAATARREADAP
ncbi:MAG TPA: hypothetical protein PLZ36_08670 [Armatimonadota bacterium]|nr:hypothetical protein [Armatimonadota bacterium]